MCHNTTTLQSTRQHNVNTTPPTKEDVKFLHTKLFYDKHMNTSHEDTILMIKNTLHILLYIAGAVGKREVREQFYYGFASRLDIYNSNRGK